MGDVDSPCSQQSIMGYVDFPCSQQSIMGDVNVPRLHVNVLYKGFIFKYLIRVLCKYLNFPMLWIIFILLGEMENRFSVVPIATRPIMGCAVRSALDTPRKSVNIKV